MADLENVVARLRTVASWHNGRQQRFVEAIIADLTGVPAAPLAAAPATPPTPTGSPVLPGEGSVPPPSGATPPG